MPRFLTADELGTVKSIRYSPADTPKEWKADIAVLAEGGTEGKVSVVQKLAAAHVSSEYLVRPLVSFKRNFTSGRAHETVC